MDKSPVDTLNPNHTHRDHCLYDHEIHIYLTDSETVPASLLARYRSIMSEQELERNQRYRMDRDRRTDCIARCLTRTTLSRYADLPPTEWLFVNNKFGKPEIQNPPIPIRFNLSHTSRFVACAVTRTYDLGIDIEFLKRTNDISSIAGHYFSDLEKNALFRLQPEQQKSRFFDYWTLKEAYLKACGVGISAGLDTFSFILDDPNTITIRLADTVDDAAEDWQFRLMSPSEDHRMAVALRRQHDKHHPKTVVRLFKTVPLYGQAEPFATEYSP